MSKIVYNFYQRNDLFDYKSGYKMVYADVIEAKENDYETLEDLFELFNVNPPKDFTGRSMSASDIIYLGEDLYMCDSIGWRELTVEDLIFGNVKTMMEEQK